MKSRRKSPSTRRGLTNSNTRVKMRRSRRCRDGQSSTILRGEEEGVEAKDEHRVSHFFGGWLWDVGCAFAMWEEWTKSRQFHRRPNAKRTLSCLLARLAMSSSWKIRRCGLDSDSTPPVLRSSVDVSTQRRRIRMRTDVSGARRAGRPNFCNFYESQRFRPRFSRQGTK